MTEGPKTEPRRPLAEMLRPKALDEVLGQAHLVGPNGILRRMAETGHLVSHILWGPSGSGKTSVVRHLASAGGYAYMPISAATAGVSAFRSVVKEAERLREEGTPTLLFVDECHRWNRSQQDIFLPYVEDGTITLVGATTENPSYEVNQALLSRCRVYRMRSLDDAALEELLRRSEALLGQPLPLEESARSMIRAMADGDGRFLLNIVEDVLLLHTERPWTATELGKVLARRMPGFDKNGRMHHALISGLQKAIRGSDPDAALYWLARLLAAGERQEVIARRLLVTAMEDVGTADPHALLQAIAAKDAAEFLGPLGELALAQCAVYLSTAPKSSALSAAMGEAKDLAERTVDLQPRFMPWGGPDYRNDHDFPDGYAGLDHLPPELSCHRLYHPVERGYEREIIRRLNYWSRLRERGTNQ
ncbi:replication-associated recombination protein A [Azospirillum sp. BE72]|uniref:replication-associated recombination protein A n=1 Tax=Azospirillum sp. BE72 TaxID=2817776 RepID=UPI0028598AFD|nr:replication-associated recombination protein A [Azospirillum sp. BE72]MDR6774848.1 putative ATPase [Azospirillum sp. BE72]